MPDRNATGVCNFGARLSSAAAFPGAQARWVKLKSALASGPLRLGTAALRFASLGSLLASTLFVCSCRHDEELVDVEKEIPGIVLDIRYATTNNFTGHQLYPVARCFLRRAATEKLREVQTELAGMGLGLKVFDGYRPLSVQKKMWAIYPHEGYVANPAKGSRHNRDAAVDVTLIKLSDGSELPMPTPYDDFTEKAHRNYKELPAEAIRNRELLERVMTKHGFVGLPTEWWHFDDKDWRQYEIMDVDYSEIKRKAGLSSARLAARQDNAT